ncbi:hypothetical protein BUALT_Bualt04G0143600 [Buddleja alternifolia]|uniref:Uncharacterized protein n=1 Tax=Buddleja alternifolia TaxID=168488 RepID=A0AAV6XQ84_9LAMI|nr:hypothetical protein BUALT_Bualt04G0143600 [Buddleja alternifolia]
MSTSEQRQTQLRCTRTPSKVRNLHWQCSEGATLGLIVIKLLSNFLRFCISWEIYIEFDDNCEVCLSLEVQYGDVHLQVADLLLDVSMVFLFMTRDWVNLIPVPVYV